VSSKSFPEVREPLQLSPPDRKTIREVARKAAEIAELPVMAERRRLWTAHNDLKPVRPMVLVIPEGGWRELKGHIELECEGERAREIEMHLRQRIFAHEVFDDDMVYEKRWIVGKIIDRGDWGVAARWDYSDDPTGARHFHPVIHTPDDLNKMHFPEVRYDEASTQQVLSDMQELLGDILPVELRGITHVSFHLMSDWTALRGLEQVMMDMIDNPQFLHDAMAFLTEGCRRRVAQYLQMGLLSLNNDNAYQSSGGVGYTEQLPAAGFDGQHVRPQDLWASAEAQELAQVSPAMHEEFSLKYEKELLAPFGLNGYGCCEDLTRKLPYVFEIPHLRRISISPWADVAKCAEQLGDRYIFSWKPHPTMIADRFHPEKIRRYIRDALAATRGCVVEMILKDTHTCCNQPQRFTEWVRIARQEVDRFLESS